jgi:putative component of membrane protein insertase Oxa1/YidC/SpoIIIJ protein YidD
MFFRSVISDITPGSCRFEDAFSDDGGKSWKVKGIAVDTRVKDESSQQNSDAPKPTLKNTGTEHDEQHDFDFEIGTWNTHLWRLVDPLTGSTKWVEYEGTSVVRKIWNGRANLVELVANGPAGHFEGLNLRLYNPQSRQWSLNFANSKGGTLTPPTIGEFKNGRGEFFDTERSGPNGRAVLVRFVISDITPDSCRFEQAFSDDGGKNWEVNWIAIDTRAKDEADKAL